MSNDLALWDQWKSDRDAEAFKEIAARYGGMMYGVARRVLRNGDDADDVVQECFQYLVTTRSGPKRHLGAWLHKVATTRSLNFRKSSKRRLERERRFTSDSEAVQEIAWDDIYVEVDSAIEALDDDLRIPVVASFLESRTHEEIADELGLARSTVTNRIRRGVDELRTILHKRGVAPAAFPLAELLETNLSLMNTLPRNVSAAVGKLALHGGASNVRHTSRSVVAASTIGIVAVIGITGLAGLSPLFRDSRNGAAFESEPIAEGTTSQEYSAIESARLADESPLGDGRGVAEPPPKSAADAIAIEGARIMGAVFTEDTDVVLAGVEISLAGSIESTTLSDENGLYRFDGLNLGEYVVSCVPPNGVIRTISSDPVSKTVQIAEGRDVITVDFPFEGGAAISGRITNRDGQPVSGVYLRLIGQGFHESKVHTDEAGRYVATGIKPNVAWQIGVYPEGYGTIASEAMLVPSEGGLENVDFILDPPTTVVGTVIDSSGAPVSGVEVSLHLSEGTRTQPPLPNANTADDGRFEIANAGPGDYLLYVSIPRELRDRYTEAPPRNPITIVPGDREVNATLVVQRADPIATIEGTVMNEAGEPVADAVVTSLSDYGVAVSDAQGRYTFSVKQGKPGDAYVLTINHDDYAETHFGNIFVGSTDANVVLRPKASLTGRVIDGLTREPITKFEITPPFVFRNKVPIPREAMLKFESNDGRFELAQLEPGRVYVQVSAKGYGTHTERLDRITEGQRIDDLVIALYPAGVIRGEVNSAIDGEPVQDAKVYYNAYSDELFLREQIGFFVTDSEGRFVIDGVSQGSVYVGAVKPGYAKAVERVSVVPNRETAVILTLIQGGTIEGFVTLNGDPVPNASVSATSDFDLNVYTITDDSGYYNFEHLTPGMYSMRTNWSRTSMNLSAEVGNGEITRGDFPLANGTAIVSLSVTRSGTPVDVKNFSIGITTDIGAGLQHRFPAQPPAESTVFEGLVAGNHVIKIHEPAAQTGDRSLYEYAIQVGEGETADVHLDLDEVSPVEPEETAAQNRQTNE